MKSLILALDSLEPVDNLGKNQKEVLKAVLHAMSRQKCHECGGRGHTPRDCKVRRKAIRRAGATRGVKTLYNQAAQKVATERNLLFTNRHCIVFPTVGLVGNVTDTDEDSPEPQPEAQRPADDQIPQ